MEYVNINVNIEAAIPKYKKGDRVIVNLNTSKAPEYYVGTVTGIRKGLVYVVFDDGDKDKFKPTLSRVGLVGITKKKTARKSQIPVKDIGKWLEIGIGKASPKSNKVSNDVCYEWFEKFIFGDNLNLPNRSNKEKNTIIEKKIFNTLSRYVDGRFISKSIDKPSLNNLKKLYKCKDYFKKYLVPDNKTSYRGFSMDSKMLLKLVKSKSKKLVKSPYAPKYGMYVYDTIYKSRVEIESWTSNKNIANMFTVREIANPLIVNKVLNIEKINPIIFDPKDNNKKELPVMIESKTNNSFFVNPKLSEKISDFEGINPEWEILRIGKEGIKCKMYIPKKFIDDLK